MYSYTSVQFCTPLSKFLLTVLKPKSCKRRVISMKFPALVTITQMLVTIAHVFGTFIVVKIISVKTPAINDQAAGNIAMKIPSGGLIEDLLIKYKMYSTVTAIKLQNI